MYGSSTGEIVGIVIGIIVGLIVVFLICRELICWYYKINKLSSQLDEQTQLLKQLLIHFGVAESSIDSILVNKINEQQVFNDINASNLEKYRAKRAIEIHYNPNTSSDSTFMIQYMDIVSLIKKGDNISENNIWYYIVNEKGMKGWCSSEYLEKM